MFTVNVYNGDMCDEYECIECGWKDSTTLMMTISKDHTIRISLLRVDKIEIQVNDD